METLLNSKLKPEKFDDARVLADRGEVEDIDDADRDDGETGPNAVFRRRSEWRGWSAWNLEYGMMTSVDVEFVMRCLIDDMICASPVYEGYRSWKKFSL